jgi:hypothetical protein
MNPDHNRQNNNRNYSKIIHSRNRLCIPFLPVRRVWFNIHGL